MEPTTVFYDTTNATITLWLQSSSPRNLRQSKTNNLLTSRIQTNDDTLLYPSGCFPTGNPLPRSLEAQPGDHRASRGQHSQSLQYQYRNSLLVNKTNAMLAKHCSNLMPPTYESVVQNNGLASAGNGRMSTPSARSSQPPIGQKVDYSQTIRTMQDCDPVMRLVWLANSAFVVRAPLFRKRVLHPFVKWTHDSLAQHSPESGTKRGTYRFGYRSSCRWGSER